MNAWDLVNYVLELADNDYNAALDLLYDDLFLEEIGLDLDDVEDMSYAEAACEILQDELTKETFKRF